jgi:hypothetical protein
MTVKMKQENEEPKQLSLIMFNTKSQKPQILLLCLYTFFPILNISLAGSGTHPASYPMGSFPGGKAVRT